MPTRNKMTTPIARRLAAALLASTLLAPAGAADAASIYFGAYLQFPAAHAVLKLSTVTGRARVVREGGYNEYFHEALAVDTDVTLYTVLNARRDVSRLAKIDRATGQITPVGALPPETWTLDIRPDGTMYASGVGVDRLEPINSKIYVYKIDKTTGAATLVAQDYMRSPDGRYCNSNPFDTTGQLWFIEDNQGARPNAPCEPQEPWASTRLGSLGGTLSSEPAGISKATRKLIDGQDHSGYSAVAIDRLGTMWLFEKKSHGVFRVDPPWPGSADPWALTLAATLPADVGPVMAGRGPTSRPTTPASPTRTARPRA